MKLVSHVYLFFCVLSVSTTLFGAQQTHSSSSESHGSCRSSSSSSLELDLLCVSAETHKELNFSDEPCGGAGAMPSRPPAQVCEADFFFAEPRTLSASRGPVAPAKAYNHGFNLLRGKTVLLAELRAELALSRCETEEFCGAADSIIEQPAFQPSKILQLIQQEKTRRIEAFGSPQTAIANPILRRTVNVVYPYYIARYGNSHADNAFMRNYLIAYMYFLHQYITVFYLDKTIALMHISDAEHATLSDDMAALHDELLAWLPYLSEISRLSELNLFHFHVGTFYSVIGDSKTVVTKADLNILFDDIYKSVHHIPTLKRAAAVWGTPPATPATRTPSARVCSLASPSHSRTA